MTNYWTSYVGRKQYVELPFLGRNTQSNATCLTQYDLLTVEIMDKLKLSSHPSGSLCILFSAFLCRLTRQDQVTIGFQRYSTQDKLMPLWPVCISCSGRQMLSDMLPILTDRFAHMDSDTISETLSLQLSTLSNIAIVETNSDTQFDPTPLFENGINMLLLYNKDQPSKLTCMALEQPAIFSMRQFVLCFEEFVINALAQPTRPLCELAFLSKQHKGLLLSQFNHNPQPVVIQNTIPTLFEKSVKQFPDNEALVFGDVSLSYQQLNAKVNQLAHWIRENYQSTTGVQLCNGQLIGISMEKSIEAIIAMLAILKAGAAYLFLDPHYPDDRLNQIIDDSQIGLLFVHSDSLGKAAQIAFATEIKTVNVDNPEFINQCQQCSSDNVNHKILPEDLAYVIYTSGSTGRPKGVMVPHCGVVNLTEAQYVLQCQSTSRVIQFAALSFDASVWEIFITLLSGACLCLIDDEVRNDIDGMRNYISDNRVTIATIPPAFLALFAASDFPTLETLVVAGEKCDEKVMLAFSGHCTVINAYGPSECSVCASMHVYQTGDSHINIGKPNTNVQCFVLDQHRCLAPVGVIGELYLGGQSLALGYLNREDLTQACFISHPFQSEMQLSENDKIYKTGDLVYWDEHGDLHYVGRADHQVKLRGHRIELSEVEGVLAKHHAVGQCIARIDADSNKLVAYYTPELAQTQENSINWWPSIAEYYAYDDCLSFVVKTHEARNTCYRVAIQNQVKDKIVLVIASGPDAILSRICIEEGAAKVYAIEYLEQTYLKAKQTIEKHGLTHHIHLIHGDSRKVSLPEKADVCVSELVGAIGGSEGVAVILNDAKCRHMKPEGVFIPERSLTHLALVSLPESLVMEPILQEKPYGYTKKIFEQVGQPFDLRLCLQAVNRQDLISTVGLFEDLSWQQEGSADPNYQHEIKLDITRSAKTYGFVVWLDLITIAGHSIDILEDQYSWLPIFLPAFPEGIVVLEGDTIRATVSRYLCDNNLNCDYRIEGEVIVNGQPQAFSYTTVHYNGSFRHNGFYQRFFDMYERYDAYSQNRIAKFLAQQLPEYMLPDYLIALDKMPLNRNGKIDTHALPGPSEIDQSQSNIESASNNHEQTLLDLWSSVLEVGNIGVNQDFFSVGGNSIAAIQVAHRASKVLPWSITAADIYQYRTVRELCDKKDCQETFVEEGEL